MPQKPLLIDPSHGALRVVALEAPGQIAADGEGKLPTRLVVFPWGENKTAKGRCIVNETTLSVLPSILAASNLDRLPLDFEHNTVPGQPSYQGEPAKIAGMGTPKVLSGEGIVFEGIEWTAEGRDHVTGKHYQDLSPVIVLNSRDEVIAISSAAVCRTGATPGLGIPLSSDLFIQKPTAQMLDPKKLLCAILNLDEAATDADIESAAKSFGETAKALTAQGAQITALSTGLKALADKQNAAEREAIVLSATQEGKVIPKEMLEGDKAITDNAQLKALVAGLQVTVPLEQRTATHLKVLSSGVNTNSTADEEVRTKLGISKEAWAKHAA